MSGSVSLPQLAHLKTGLMKCLLRCLGVFQCAGGSCFVRMNAGVIFTWLTKCREIGNSCECFSWVGVVWEGFDLLPVSLCERVEVFPHQDPAVACAVTCSLYNKPSVSASAWGAVLQSTLTEQSNFTNKQNIAITYVFLLSLCFHVLFWSFHSLFSHLFCCFCFTFPSSPCVWLCPRSEIPL